MYINVNNNDSYQQKTTNTYIYIYKSKKQKRNVYIYTQKATHFSKSKTIFDPVPDTPSSTTSTPTVVADCHGVKWYNYEDVIYLDEFPSLQWKSINQFGDPFYPKYGVWMSRLDAWLIMYGKKTFASFFDNANLELLWQGRNTFKETVKTLQLQCVVRLRNRFEFGKRDELWIIVGRKYMPAVEFGKTGMECERFKEIFSAQRY